MYIRQSRQSNQQFKVIKKQTKVISQIPESTASRITRINARTRIGAQAREARRSGSRVGLDSVSNRYGELHHALGSNWDMKEGRGRNDKIR